MIIQSMQTQLYVIFTWRLWFLLDHRFTFIEWFCLLYPVERIPDHKFFSINWDLVNLFRLLSVFSVGLLLEIVVLFSLAIWIPRQWSISKVFQLFLPHLLFSVSSPAWLRWSERDSLKLSVLLALRIILKDHKMTVIDTSPWLASAALFLAVINQFK